MPESHVRLDFNLHGRVGVRISGAERIHLLRLARRLGLAEGMDGNEPDLEIDHVESFRGLAPLASIGAGGAAFSEEAFFVRAGRGARVAKAQVAFEAVGQPGCRIITDDGPAIAPLLRHLLHVTALGKGLVPIHGAAFVHDGVGTLVSGWSQSGKTGALLTFLSRGARFLAADWVHLRDGQLYGTSEPIRLRAWHVAASPAVRSRISTLERIRLGALRRGASASMSLSRRVPVRGLDRLAGAVDRRSFVDVPADRLFPHAVARSPERLGRVILTVPHEDRRVRVISITSADMASRLTTVFQGASEDLGRQYLMFRFAFPDRRSELIERAEAMMRDELERALANVDRRVVYQPYPGSSDDLFDALQ